MKFLHVLEIFPELYAYLYENDSLWHKISPKVPGTGNFFLWQEISSCDNPICGKKFLLVARNFFLWQEISFCGKKFILWQDISSLEKYLLWHYFCIQIMLLFPKESSSSDTRKCLLTTEKHWFGRNFLHHLAGNTFVSSLWQNA